MFEIPAALLSLFYGLTNGYSLAIGLMAVAVIMITTPLTLNSTRGMLAMQRLEPEMRRLQNEYRNDRDQPRRSARSNGSTLGRRTPMRRSLDDDRSRARASPALLREQRL